MKPGLVDICAIIWSLAMAGSSRWMVGRAPVARARPMGRGGRGRQERKSGRSRPLRFERSRLHLPNDPKGDVRDA